LVVVGAVLIAGLAVIALAGSRLFGPAGRETPGPESAALVAPSALGTPRADFLASTPSTPVAAVYVPTGRAPVVCLDPGHGGPDRGFTRQATDLAPAMEEAVLVLEHAWDLEYRLSQLGYKVVMTRRTDAAVNADGRDVNGDGKTAKDDPPGTARYATLDELQARINICNEAGADLLVSMHVNGYSNGDPHGFETWYTPNPARPFGDRNEAFATLAYVNLKEQLGSIGYALSPAEERGVLPDTSADVQNEHSVFKHFIITGPAVPGQIIPSRMPGAIVEALFVSNDIDAAVLASPVGRATIVTAYQNAIVDYFEQYPPEPKPE